MKRMRIAVLLLIVVMLVATSCSGSGGTTTTTAASGGTETTAAPASNVTLKFWSTETQPARLEKTQKIIDAFTAETGIQVQLTATDEDALPQLMLTNAASGTLPDVVFHPLDFTAGWAQAGLLDVDAANEVVQDLDPSTFSAGAMTMVTVNGKVAAVPSDGWGQLLIYRKDIFDKQGLDTPDTYAKIQAAAEALNDPGNNFYGITAANDPSAVFTQQTYEGFALADNCQLVDDSGQITLDSSNCVASIQFFTDLLSKYSPAGLQDVVSTRATYFAGQAGMIIWSPFILDEMAGLRDSAMPTCPECASDPAYLAKNSGFVPAFAGPDGSPAQYGQVSYLGIGKTDNTEEAKKFVEYWLSTGYLDWLSVAPEGKIPMRHGTTDDPTKYIEGWKTLETGVDRKAPLSDFYSSDVINDLVNGSNNFTRWGYPEGQGALVGVIYSTLLVPQVLDEVFSGQLTPDQAAQQMQTQAEDEQKQLQDSSS
jgi:multiple sugar transport system substrate-binding protein